MKFLKVELIFQQNGYLLFICLFIVIIGIRNNSFSIMKREKKFRIQSSKGSEKEKIIQINYLILKSIHPSDFFKKLIFVDLFQA